MTTTCVSESYFSSQGTRTTYYSDGSAMRHPAFTFSVTPHMCETSNSDACSRQCFVASMMESLYWIGIDHPANGTILPAPCTTFRD